MSEKESDNKTQSSDLENTNQTSTESTQQQVDSPKQASNSEKEREKTTDELREENLLRDDMRLGGSPEGKATNEALRSLARASRSFLIYDTKNEAIRDFLRSYREAMFGVLEKYDEMDLEIRPFEMLRDGEVVYLERDRERSLAFKLFRDGVRSVIIEPEVVWEELLRLLEILSIRFTGIRQQEDDVVTLLLKAGFKGIRISAVEGFVPDDEEYCGDDPDAAAARKYRSKRRVESHVEVPHDWDLPVPDLPKEPDDISFEEISSDIESQFRREASSTFLANNTVRLVTEMMKIVADPTDPTKPEDVEHLIAEVRDFLLSDGQLSSLLSLMKNIDEILQDTDQDAEELLRTFANERAISKIIRGIPKGTEKPPDDLIELLNLAQTDHLNTLIRMLEIERSITSRRITQQLIAKYATNRIDYGLQRLEIAEGDVAADILESLYIAQPDQADKIIKAALQRQEMEIQFRALQLMEQLDDLSLLCDDLYIMQKSPVEEVRLRSLPFLIQISDRNLFPTLLERLKNTSEMSFDEAILLGETLAQLKPKRAKQEMEEWVRPKGLITLGSVRDHQQYAAVKALSLIPGKSNVDKIRKLREATGAELSQYCGRALYERRKLEISDEEL
jgi:hypothetical protein